MQTYLTLKQLGILDSESPSSSSSISPQSLALEYYQGLQQGAATTAAHRKAATNAAGVKAWAEFSQWMSERASITGRGPWDATPQDLLVYMETHWLPQHGELVLSDQQLHASPGYVRGTLSHLSSIYKLAGKETSWDSSTQVGPPLACSAMHTGLHMPEHSPHKPSVACHMDCRLPLATYYHHITQASCVCSTATLAWTAA